MTNTLELQKSALSWELTGILIRISNIEYINSINSWLNPSEHISYKRISYLKWKYKILNTKLATLI